ncbi:MAG: hypothetical protein ACRDCA_25010 [Serratia sp. (in: enterobacteria)]|uniref:hypothetical protein n=1 Tax=Serratia sp. (in: enterobacteria) TaxID=616 RepID=UPI003F361C79
MPYASEFKKTEEKSKENENYLTNTENETELPVEIPSTSFTECLDEEIEADLTELRAHLQAIISGALPGFYEFQQAGYNLLYPKRVDIDALQARVNTMQIPALIQPQHKLLEQAANAFLDRFRRFRKESDLHNHALEFIKFRLEVNKAGWDEPQNRDYHQVLKHGNRLSGYLSGVLDLMSLLNENVEWQTPWETTRQANYDVLLNELLPVNADAHNNQYAAQTRGNLTGKQPDNIKFNAIVNSVTLDERLAREALSTEMERLSAKLLSGITLTRNYAEKPDETGETSGIKRDIDFLCQVLQSVIPVVQYAGQQIQPETYQPLRQKEARTTRETVTHELGKVWNAVGQKMQGAKASVQTLSDKGNKNKHRIAHALPGTTASDKNGDSHNINKAVFQVGIRLLDKIQQTTSDMHKAIQTSRPLQQAISHYSELDEMLSGMPSNSILDAKLRAESGRWRQKAEESKEQLQQALGIITTLSDESMKQRYLSALREELNAVTQPLAANTIIRDFDTQVKATVEGLSDVQKALGQALLRLSEHGQAGGKELGKQTVSWLQQLKGIKDNLKTGITQATGQSINNFSRQGMLARWMAEWSEAEKQRYLATLSVEERAATEKHYDNVFFEVIQHYLPQLSKESDPQGERLLQRLRLEVGNAAKGNTLYPATMAEILAGMKSREQAIRDWSERKLIRGAFLAVCLGGFKLLPNLAAFPLRLPIKFAITGAKVAWGAHKGRQGIRGGEGDIRDEIAEYAKQSYKTAAIKIVLSLPPGLATTLGVASIAWRVYEGGLKGAGEKIAERIIGEAPWRALDAGSKAAAEAYATTLIEAAITEEENTSASHSSSLQPQTTVMPFTDARDPGADQPHVRRKRAAVADNRHDTIFPSDPTRLDENDSRNIFYENRNLSVEERHVSKHESLNNQYASVSTQNHLMPSTQRDKVLEELAIALVNFEIHDENQPASDIDRLIFAYEFLYNKALSEDPNKEEFKKEWLKFRSELNLIDNTAVERFLDLRWAIELYDMYKGKILKADMPEHGNEYVDEILRLFEWYRGRNSTDNLDCYIESFTRSTGTYFEPINIAFIYYFLKEIKEEEYGLTNKIDIIKYILSNKREEGEARFLDARIMAAQIYAGMPTVSIYGDRGLWLKKYDEIRYGPDDDPWKLLHIESMLTYLQENKSEVSFESARYMDAIRLIDYLLFNSDIELRKILKISKDEFVSYSEFKSRKELDNDDEAYYDQFDSYIDNSVAEKEADRQLLNIVTSLQLSIGELFGEVEDVKVLSYIYNNRFGDVATAPPGRVVVIKLKGSDTGAIVISNLFFNNHVSRISEREYNQLDSIFNSGKPGSMAQRGLGGTYYYRGSQAEHTNVLKMLTGLDEPEIAEDLKKKNIAFGHPARFSKEYPKQEDAQHLNNKTLRDAILGAKVIENRAAVSYLRSAMYSLTGWEEIAYRYVPFYEVGHRNQYDREYEIDAGQFIMDLIQAAAVATPFLKQLATALKGLSMRSILTSGLKGRVLINAVGKELAKSGIDITKAFGSAIYDLIDPLPLNSHLSGRTIFEDASSAMQATRFQEKWAVEDQIIGNVKPDENGVYKVKKTEAETMQDFSYYIKVDNKFYPVKYDLDKNTVRIIPPKYSGRSGYQAPVRRNENGEWVFHTDVGLKGGGLQDLLNKMREPSPLYKKMKAADDWKKSANKATDVILVPQGIFLKGRPSESLSESVLMGWALQSGQDVRLAKKLMSVYSSSNVADNTLYKSIVDLHVDGKVSEFRLAVIPDVEISTLSDAESKLFLTENTSVRVDIPEHTMLLSRVNQEGKIKYVFYDPNYGLAYFDKYKDMSVFFKNKLEGYNTPWDSTQFYQLDYSILPRVKIKGRNLNEIINGEIPQLYKQTGVNLEGISPHEGVYRTPGDKNYIKVNDDVYQVEWDQTVNTWRVFDPANTNHSRITVAVRRDANGEWFRHSDTGLQGGGLNDLCSGEKSEQGAISIPIDTFNSMPISTQGAHGNRKNEVLRLYGNKGVPMVTKSRDGNSNKKPPNPKPILSSEHTILHTVSAQGLGRGDNIHATDSLKTTVKKIENLGHAYQEYDEAHRKHIGSRNGELYHNHEVGVNPMTEAEYLARETVTNNFATYADTQRSLLHSDDVSSAIQINQMGYFSDSSELADLVRNNSESQRTHDSFYHSVSVKDSYYYLKSDSEVVRVDVTNTNKIEMILSRLMGVLGRIPSNKELKNVLEQHNVTVPGGLFSLLNNPNFANKSIFKPTETVYVSKNAKNKARKKGRKNAAKS